MRELNRRRFVATTAATAAALSPFTAAITDAAGPVQVAAQGEGADRWRALRYGGIVTAHDRLGAAGASGALLVAAEIRLAEYDAKTGLPPKELIEKVATEAAARGAERLILNGRTCYDGRLNRDALTAKCVALNQAGRLCMSKRIGLRYRNGKGEFGGNGLEMEEMMLRINPQLVGVALDAAEVKKAGADMVNFLARHQNRIDCIFLRDWQTVDYAPLAAEIATRRWSGWLIQSPGGAEGRRAISKLFGV